MHFKHQYYPRCNSNTEMGVYITFLVIMLLIGLGYLMNFQNIIEYWPVNSQLNNCSLEFVLSSIGIVLIPLGVFMGYMF